MRSGVQDEMHKAEAYVCLDFLSSKMLEYNETCTYTVDSILFYTSSNKEFEKEI